MNRIHPFEPREAFLLDRPFEPQIGRLFLKNADGWKFLKIWYGL
jgi:hypothetical protein